MGRGAPVVALLGLWLTGCGWLSGSDPDESDEPLWIACSRNADCTADLPHCVEGRCQRCAENEHCYPEERCVAGSCEYDERCELSGVAVGRCAFCDAASDCRSGEVCVRGSCVLWTCGAAPEPERYCQRTALTSREGMPGCALHDSSLGLILSGLGCDGPTLRHPAPPLCDPCYESIGGCASEAHCTDGLRCACADDSECPGATECVDGLCAHRRCESDADCDCEAHCDGWRCRPLCTADADCPSGYCDRESGRCVHCRSDADCDLGQRCYENGCVEPCVTEDDCLDSCTSSGRCEGCEHYLEGMPAPTERPGCE